MNNKIILTILCSGTFLLGYFFSNGLDVIANNNTSYNNASSTNITIDQSQNKILDEVKNIMDEKFISWKATATKPTQQDINYGIVNGYVSAYKDPYTIFFKPEEAKSFTENVKGSFGGVGMEVGEKSGLITVISPLKDSPSQKAGIKTGDIILKINDEPVSDYSVEHTVSLIRGEVGTKVKITIFRQSDKKEYVYDIVRDVVKIPTIDTEIINGVFVIHFYSFSQESPELFRKALLEFSNTNNKKLLIDLRSNPGGYLESAVQISSFFLPEGKVIVEENSGAKDTHDSNNNGKTHRSLGFDVFRNSNVKIYVLIDGGSASASEILAGALKDHKVAIIIGQKSYGKGSVQELINLSDGSALKVTVANWYTPGGTSITQSGITPEIELKRTSTTTAISELKEALKIINLK